MDAPVFISARASELRLRREFVLPVMDPELHAARSNGIIQQFLGLLYIEAKRIFEEEQFLEIEMEETVSTDHDTDTIGLDDDEEEENVHAAANQFAKYNLTSEARTILLAHNNTTLDRFLEPATLTWVQQVRHALDVIAAIEELETAKCHFLRIDMEKTGLPYKLRDVMALLAFCVMQASGPRGGLVIGVTPRDALAALARGIANAARGENRDVPGHTDDFDNLADASPECDMGCYNALMQSMAGVLPQVTIVYSYMEAFNLYLQHKICEQLAKSATSVDIAHAFLNLWLTSTLPLANQPEAYRAFVLAVKAAFAGMKVEFAMQNCRDDVEQHIRIVDYLTAQVTLTNTQTGVDFLESVSPTHEALDTAWNRLHGQSVVKHTKVELLQDGGNRKRDRSGKKLTMGS